MSYEIKILDKDIVGKINIFRNENKVELEELGKTFLGEIYGSFYILNKEDGKYDLNKILESLLFNIKEKSNIGYDLRSFSEATLGLKDIFGNNFSDSEFNIKNLYLFPYIKIRSDNYPLDGKTEKVKSILEQFSNIFFRHVCLIEMMGKIVLFTDIDERALNASFEKLNNIGYKKIKLQSIIPKILNSFSEKLKSKEKNTKINRLGISFPLLMLGTYANIITEYKDSNESTVNHNFSNLIRYGLLDSAKITSTFKLSFNVNNKRDKYTMPGYILDRNQKLNQKLFENIRDFINEIDKEDSGAGKSNFAGLPIYILTGGKEFNTPKLYPKFYYIPENDKLILNLDNINSNNTSYENIKGKFIITGFYPQYQKERIRAKDEERPYFYITKKNNLEEIDGKDEDTFEVDSKLQEYLVENQDSINCKDFLEGIRDILSERYEYIPEDGKDSLLENQNGAQFLVSDLYLTAVSCDNDDKGDYLINFEIVKKKKNYEYQIFLNLYSLSCFDFGMEQIKNITTKYFSHGLLIDQDAEQIKKNRIPRTNLGWIIRKKTKDFYHFNGTIRKKVIPENQELVEKEEFIIKDIFKFETSKIGDRFIVPNDFKKDYINEKVPMEDIWSFSLIKLLENKGHKAFFSGRTKYGKTLEFADIISFEDYSTEYGEGKNINLFHIKKGPFEQTENKNSVLGFSQYTEVMGQILEKIKPFLFSNSREQILKGIEEYFSAGANSNEIYDSIREVFTSYKGNIHIQVFFPVRENDYFHKDIDDLKHINKSLSLETNWKRLKILNDIFTSNLNNETNTNKKISFSLGIIICSPRNNKNEKDILKNKISLVSNINTILFQI